MNVYLFGFQKKKNSTAIPALNTGTAFDMELKNETSVMNPVLLLNQSTTGMPSPFTPSYYTYAYIDKFGRYYFVTDWQWADGLWYCYLTEDVLGSFKTTIGTTSAYVTRSASAYDTNVVDNLYPVKTDATIRVTDFGTIFSMNTGCYVLGVIDCQNTTNRVGAVTYWALTESQLNDLLQFLYSDTIYNISSITQIESGLFKAVMNPGQYIVSCMWLPYAVSTIASGSSATITLGYWTTTISGKVVNTLTLRAENVKAFTNHPQISRGNYLNFAPYSRYTLFYPPFGSIPVDPIFRTLGDYLCVQHGIDVITGKAFLRLSVQDSTSSIAEGSKKVFAERSAQVGVPIQISQVNTDMISAVGSGISSIISGVTDNWVGAASGVVSALSTLASPREQSLGYNGSFLETYSSHKLISEFYSQSNVDYADHGKPLMQTKTINTLSGYIKCSDAHFSGSCYDSERDTINQFMNDGFFYE